MRSATQRIIAAQMDAVIRVYDDAGNVIETHEHRARVVTAAARFDLLVCLLACLPDKRHITRPSTTTAVVDKR